MIVLYLHYFKHSNIDRRKELDYCARKNITNKKFNKVVFLLEKEDDKQNWMIGDNVEVVSVNKRMNFKDVFMYINSVDNNDINVLCNLDIFFDDTISKLNEHDLDNHFVTLTRWNIDTITKTAKLFNVNCSQDTWIWKGKVDLDKIDLEFGFGEPGCDNAICGVFHEAGYKVINPSLDIKTYHLHQDTKRDYTDNDVVRKRLYLLYPTADWKQSTIQYWKDCSNFIPKN